MLVLIVRTDEWYWVGICMHIKLYMQSLCELYTPFHWAIRISDFPMYKKGGVA